MVVDEEIQTTRQLVLATDSRYNKTKLYQVSDDLRRRPLSPGRKILDKNRDLPNTLMNQVNKRLNVFTWGVWVPPEIAESQNDIIHTVTGKDGGRIDTLAYDFYGNPNLWWAIAYANNLFDPLTEVPPGTKLRIPSYDHVISAALDSTTDTVQSFIRGGG